MKNVHLELEELELLTSRDTTHYTLLRKGEEQQYVPVFSIEAEIEPTELLKYLSGFNATADIVSTTIGLSNENVVGFRPTFGEKTGCTYFVHNPVTNMGALVSSQPYAHRACAMEY